MLIDRLKAAAQADLRALAEEAGFRHARGKRFHCAFHPDRTPSVWLYDNGPHCFSCDETWDAIDLGQMITGASVAEAMRWLSERYRISRDSGRRSIPRPSEAALSEADLFRLGFVWNLERYLVLLKEAWAIDESWIQPALIAKVTRLLLCCEKWTAYECVTFYREYRKRRPKFAGTCVAEAREFQILLARVIASIPVEESEGRIAA